MSSDSMCIILLSRDEKKNFVSLQNGEFHYHQRNPITNEVEVIPQLSIPYANYVVSMGLRSGALIRGRAGFLYTLPTAP